MQLYSDLAKLMLATEATPLRVGNVEFWIDATGPWTGQLSYSPSSERWDVLTMAQDVARLAVVYPEVKQIVAQYR